MKNCILLVFWLLTGIAAFAQENNRFLYNGVLVVEKNDTTSIDGAKVCAIKFKDRVFTSNCSYFEVVKTLTEEVKEKGGNIMKITAHKAPDAWSTCDRISADVYKVPDTRVYEKQVEWSANRKLTVADFKGEPNPLYANEVAALTAAGFGFETNRVTMFKSPKFFVYSRFNCYDSWFKDEYKNSADVMQHEQSHFDLNEVYARKLLKALTELHLTVADLHHANEVFESVYAEYKERQKQYDSETKHGTDKVQQQQWNNTIANELQSLDAYRRD